MVEDSPRIAFVTRNELGEACIETLLEAGANVTDIYTRPRTESVSDQVSFDSYAERDDIAVHYVESINDPSTKDSLEAAAPEVLFVVGWSELVDAEVRSVPELAALGMHPSPLPRGRGRAPIAWSLIKGLEETALTAFHLEKAADKRDIVAQVPIRIDREDHAADLFEEVVDAGRAIVRELYPAFERRTAPAEEQDDEQATLRPVRRPHHGLVDWTRSSEAVYN